ncbi:hypothetical protein Tco_0907033 [Tanacetum coccineum]|uniref:Uncharacterized protein n=1 Tax=Tanacetum coccineum TaxID=301880 RepID=A0ABQ5CLG0_9ASTR
MFCLCPGHPEKANGFTFLNSYSEGAPAVLKALTFINTSTRKQLETDAMWCFFNEFLTHVEPKNFKQALEHSVYNILSSRLWIFKIKLDEYGDVLKNIARLVAKGYRQEAGMILRKSFARKDLRSRASIACVTSQDKLSVGLNSSSCVVMTKLLRFYHVRILQKAVWSIQLCSPGKPGKHIYCTQIYVEDIIFAFLPPLKHANDLHFEDELNF